MRIIERKEWELEVTCPVCRSRMVVDAGDVRHGNFGGYGGDNDFHYYCKCGVCTHDIKLVGHQIPPHIKNSCRGSNGSGIDL